MEDQKMNELRKAYGNRFSRIEIDADNVQRTPQTTEGDLSMLRPRTPDNVQMVDETNEQLQAETPKKRRKR